MSWVGGTQGSVIVLATLAACSASGLSPRGSSVEPIEQPEDPDPATCDPVIRLIEIVDFPITCPKEHGWSEPFIRARVRHWYPMWVGPFHDTNDDGIVDDLDAPRIFAIRPEREHRPVVHHVWGILDGELNVLQEGPSGFAGGMGFMGDLDDGNGYGAWYFRRLPEYDFSYSPMSLTVMRPSGHHEDSNLWSVGFVQPRSIGFVGTRTRPVVIDAAGMLWSPPDAHSIRIQAQHQYSLGGTIADIFGTGERLFILADSVVRADGSTVCSRSHPLIDLAVIDHDGDGRPLTLGVFSRQDDRGIHHTNLTLFEGCEPIKTIYSAPCVLHRLDSGQPLCLKGGFAIADFLGNGERQIAVGVVLGFGPEDGPSAGYRLLSMTGDVIWSKSGLLPNVHQNSSPLAVDFDGDGAHEIIVDGGLILDGATGEMLYRLPNSEAIYQHFIADLDQDGSMDLISAAHSPEGDYDLVVYSGRDGWAPGPSCWPSYAFDGTNINPDCSIPRDPTPPWLAGNTYRAVPSRPAPPREGADLAVRFVEVCELECDELRARVAVQVGNLGLLPVEEPVRLEIYGIRGDERVLLQDHRLPEVPATTWLAALDMYLFVEGGYDDLEARVVQEGEPVRQCDEDNDVARYGASVCR